MSMSHATAPHPSQSPSHATAPHLSQGPSRGASTRALSRLRSLAGDEGMSTIEYAIGCVAAAAFAAILYSVLSGESVVTALTALVQRALSTTF